MKIYHKVTGKLIFEGANLEGANLEGANLWGANLEGANLWGANLEGANLWGVRGNNIQIKSLHIFKYDIAYTDQVLQIGCENHKITEWMEFTDQTIGDMGGGAIEWWKQYKEIIFNIINLR